MENFCSFVRWCSYPFDCKFLPRKILTLVIYPLPNSTLVRFPVPWSWHVADRVLTPNAALPLPDPTSPENIQTHTEDSKEYIQQMAALRGVSAADYAIMTGGPTRLIKAFFPAQPLLMPSL